MVAAFFYAKSYFDLTQVNEPIVLFRDVRIGGPVNLVAGVVLVALRVREYVHGHSHGYGDTYHDHDDDHECDHGDGSHHSHYNSEESRFGRLTARIPFLGGHDYSHDALDGSADRGLLGITWFAFILGFAHEEEIEIIALCAGSPYYLELMIAYALTVSLGIVGLTMLMITGY